MRNIFITIFVLMAIVCVHASENALSTMSIPIGQVLNAKPERPILILHRGGVITSEAPECSLAAARLAGEQGYEMLEVDVRESKDGVPVSFHDNTMMDDTGKAGKAEDYTAEELAQIKFLGSDETIPTLEQILRVCKEYGMGLMLNIKTDGSEGYYQTIKNLIIENGLQHSTVCIDPLDKAIRYLSEVSMFPLSRDAVEKIEAGEEVDTTNKFWFGRSANIDHETVEILQNNGILVVPAFNIFLYPEAEHMEHAQAEIERMKDAGVMVYQIDSVYAEFFDR